MNEEWREEQMLELSEDYQVSMTRVLTNVTSHDSVYARRFLFTALALINPMDKDLEDSIDECSRWAIENDPLFSDMTGQNIIDNSTHITISAIERYYELNPDKLIFVVDYKSFFDLWVGGDLNDSDDPKKTTTSSLFGPLSRAAKSAYKMGFGREAELFKKNKTIKVTSSIPVFRSVKIIGLSNIVIKLNPDFLPYIVLLNQVFIGRGFDSFPVSYLVGIETLPAFTMVSFALRFFEKGKNPTQKFTFKTNFLREQLGCEDKYPKFHDFYNKVILKGAEGVNAAGSIKMEITQNKRGRITESIGFTITSESLAAKKNQKKSSDKKKFSPNEVLPNKPFKESAEKAEARAMHLNLMNKMTGRRITS